MVVSAGWSEGTKVARIICTVHIKFEPGFSTILYPPNCIYNTSY